ncbi:MAG: prolipoprotein diacylglyceryl transferase, partial [Deltaproteobacteria bacterium]|nr:prolipoprotein diacylglyceryl transferase [Deltaproteobacteria bacterium]
MIPYFEQPVLPLGPLKIHAFGVLVATAMLVGIQMTL